MQPRPLLHIASQLFDSPLAILPEKLEAVLVAFGPRFGLTDPDLESLLSSEVLRPRRSYGVTTLDRYLEVEYADQPDSPRDRKPYQTTTSGIAVLPVSGILMKRGGWMSSLSGCSAYDTVSRVYSTALADPAVRGILLDIDSPGGTTHGCFELSDSLHGLRSEKPTRAIANDLAASAAYALASSASEVYVTRTGAVGSVGVFALHVDQSKADEKMGVKFTYVYAGDKKVDGNPHEPLSRAAKKDIQSEVDRECEIFVQTVARNRGRSEDDIRGTQASVEYADQSVPMLADKMASFEEAIADFESDLDRRSRSRVSLVSSTQSVSSAVGVSDMPAIPPHKTATSDGAWNGPANKKRLREGEDAAYYRSAYAFAKPDKDPKTKAGYSYIHHDISGDGSVGAANLKGCSSGIGVLNGGRGGTVLKGADREGVYRHLSRHLKDGKQEPPPLKSQREYLEAMAEYGRLTEDEDLVSVAESALSTLLQSNTGGAGSMARTKEQIQAEIDKLQTELAAADCDPSKMKSEEADDEMKAADKGKEDEEEDDEKEDNPDEEKKEKSASIPVAAAPLAHPPAKPKEKVTRMPAPNSVSAATQISELCLIAGCPERAAQFILDEKSIEDVRKVLRDERAAKSAETAPVASFGTTAKADALTNIASAAKQLAASANISNSAAYERLLRANLPLYTQYNQERAAAAMQASFGLDTSSYMQQVERVMQSMNLSTAR